MRTNDDRRERRTDVLSLVAKSRSWGLAARDAAERGNGAYAVAAYGRQLAALRDLRACLKAS